MVFPVFVVIFPGKERDDIKIGVYKNRHVLVAEVQSREHICTKNHYKRDWYV